MEYKKFDSQYVVRIDKGEEIVDTLREFCKENDINLGSVSGIGAVDKIKIGLFETSSKEYHGTELNGDHEITNLTGNISTKDDEIYLHLHINLSDSKYNTYGGHLNSAVVSGTCEIIINEIEGKVDREFSDEIGLNLYKF
ncbi:MAG: PPC domain-containing DNA-binding protein [Bacillota bacterium]